MTGADGKLDGAVQRRRAHARRRGGAVVDGEVRMALGEEPGFGGDEDLRVDPAVRPAEAAE